MAKSKVDHFSVPCVVYPCTYSDLMGKVQRVYYSCEYFNND